MNASWSMFQMYVFNTENFYFHSSKQKLSPFFSSFCILNGNERCEVGAISSELLCFLSSSQFNLYTRTYKFWDFDFIHGSFGENGGFPLVFHLITPT